MAKIQIKAEKLISFGVIFSIMEQFDALLFKTIGSTLGKHSKFTVINTTKSPLIDVRIFLWQFMLKAILHSQMKEKLWISAIPVEVIVWRIGYHLRFQKSHPFVCKVSLLSKIACFSSLLILPYHL